MTRPHHRLLLIVFALLFLGLQHEGQVHALQHLRGLLHAAHEQGIQAPLADTACLECSLLAGGSSVVAPAVAALPLEAPAPLRATGAAASRSLPAPSYYSSRAPPTLL